LSDVFKDFFGVPPISKNYAFENLFLSIGVGLSATIFCFSFKKQKDFHSYP